MDMREVARIYCMICNHRVERGETLITHIEREHPHTALRHGLGKFYAAIENTQENQNVEETDDPAT